MQLTNLPASSYGSSERQKQTPIPFIREMHPIFTDKSVKLMVLEVTDICSVLQAGIKLARKFLKLVGHHMSSLVQ